MSRPSTSHEKRAAFLPKLAGAFAERGYRRATTAVLAERCGVRQNILYRLWPDKKAMFIAAIGHVFAQSAARWGRVLAEGAGDGSDAERLLAHEARHYGDAGLYRIVFAGLNETDDAEIRAALADMFRRYHRFIQRRIAAHRGAPVTTEETDAAQAAWGLVGLGTTTSILRELNLLGDRGRGRLLTEVGRLLLRG